MQNVRKWLKNAKRSLAVGLLLVVSIGAANPSTATATTVATTTEVEEPLGIKENYLRLTMRQPRGFNPILNEDSSVDAILKLIFEPVFTLNEQLKPVPNLAESYDLSADGMNMTIRLKDLFWDDGTKLTAKDFAYTLETIRNAGEKTLYKSAVRNLQKYSIVDEKTITLTFSQPFGASAYLLTFPLIPEHYFKNAKGDGLTGSGSFPSGNGSYKFDSFENLKELRLTASETTFKEKSKIKDIKVIITADGTTDLYAFDQSLIDIIPSELVKWGKYRGTKETGLHEYVSTYVDFIGFNFNVEIFNDKRIRQAIASALPMDKIISEVYLNHAVRTYSLISPSSWLSEPTVSKQDFDLEKTKELLNEVKSEWGTDLSFRFLVNSENEERMKIAKLLKENLAGIGFFVEVEEKSFAEYAQAIQGGDYELFFGGFNLSVVPDLSFAFHSTNAAAPQGSTHSATRDKEKGADESLPQIQQIAGKNFFNYRNDHLDSLLSLAFNSPTESSFREVSGEIQRHLADELPCISLVFRKSAILTDQRVKGEIKPSVLNVYQNIFEWELE